MQDPGGDQPAPVPVPDALPPLPPQGQGNPAAPGGPGLFDNPASGPFDPQPGTMPPINVPPPASPVGPPFGGGGVPGGPSPGSTPVGAGEPPGSFPSIPGMGMTNVGPDRNDPFPNRAFADIITSVEEAPTGRFMIGVGANSFQGLMGSVTIYEKNFDITNVPRSFADIANGQAFRGGGQSLQISLSGGHLDQHDAGHPPRALPLRPADRCQRVRLSVPAALYQLGRAPRRGAVQPGTTARHQCLCRSLRLGRGSGLLRLQVSGTRRLPGRQRIHPVVRPHAQPPPR